MNILPARDQARNAMPGRTLSFLVRFMASVRGVEYFSIKRLPVHITTLLRAMGEITWGKMLACGVFFSRCSVGRSRKMPAENRRADLVHRVFLRSFFPFFLFEKRFD